MDDHDPQVELNPAHAGAFLRALGLRLDAISPHEVRAHRDVTSEHHTPWGITHGGVYAFRPPHDLPADARLCRVGRLPEFPPLTELVGRQRLVEVVHHRSA